MSDAIENEYLEVIKSLAKPSLTQTMNFVKHVCKDHYWVERISLGLQKPIQFIFYLDPFLDQLKDGGSRNYNKILFGNWNYYTPDFIRFPWEGFILNAEGKRIPIPDWIKKMGYVEVTPHINSDFGFSLYSDYTKAYRIYSNSKLALGDSNTNDNLSKRQEFENHKSEFLRIKAMFMDKHYAQLYLILDACNKISQLLEGKEFNNAVFNSGIF